MGGDIKEQQEASRENTQPPSLSSEGIGQIDQKLIATLLSQIGQQQKEDEISLYDYWLIIKRKWKTLALIFFLAIFFSAIVSLKMTPIYRATTTLIPVEPTHGISSAISQLTGGIPLISGMVKGLPATTAEKLMSILQSRTVSEGVIKNLGLIDKLSSHGRESWLYKLRISIVGFLETISGYKDNKESERISIEECLRNLKEMIHISKNREGLISISVDYKDPKIAADIANQFASELQDFLQKNALTFAKKNRIFIENQLKAVKEELTNSEEKLKNFQSKTKIVSMDAQAEAALKALAEIKAQIMLREMQLGVLREFATEQNIDVIRTKDEIRELKKQYAMLESQKGNPKGSPIPSLEEAPEVGLDYIRLKRKAMIDEKLYELLKQQYEMAKIEEAKEDISFQVIDRAIPPDKRIKPKRGLIVSISGIFSIFLGIFYIFFMEYLEKERKLRSSIEKTH
jgi:uncharacterized protein involved in exopolysaccharide biosynthesis